MAYVENLLASDEQILLKQRPHWIAFIGPIISLIWGAIFLFILTQLFDVSGPPRGVAALVEQFFPFRSSIQPVVQQLPPWFLPLLFLIYGLLLVLGFLGKELRLLNIISLITSQRVIEARGVLSKTVLDTSLEKITDVRLSQSWVGRLLGYGHLSIMTASEMGFNDMAYLPNPVEFKRMMLEAKNATPTMRAGGGGRPAPQSNVTDRLAQLEQLRQQGLINQSEFDSRRQKILDEI